MEAPPAVYKLPERFVSVSTKACAIERVACHVPRASINCVSCRGRVGGPSESFRARERRGPVPELRHPLVRAGASSSDGLPVRRAAIRFTARLTTDWNETEWAAAKAAGAGRRGLRLWDAGVVPASYASRDILECVAPSLEPKRALHTVEVSSAAITSSIQEVEVRLNLKGEGWVFIR